MRPTPAAPRAWRHLASPLEAVASLVASAGPRAVEHDVRTWPGVAVASLTMGAPGAGLVPPVGFYGIAVTTEGARRTAMLVHGPGVGGHCAWTRAGRLTWVCLDAALLAGSRDANPDAPAAPDAFWSRPWPSCETLLAELAAEATRPSDAAQPARVGALATVVATRLAARLASRGRGVVRPSDGLGPRRFARVRRFIDEHLGEPIALSDLARVAGLSRFHFARQFRRRTGESPMGYVLRARIERAKRLLRASDVRIADVAAELGFADQSHFTRTFRRFVGMAPSGFDPSRFQRRPPAAGPVRRTSAA